MVSDVVSEPPTNKIRSLSSSIIIAVYNTNLAAKLTITQEEGYVAYYTTHVEEEFPEPSKAS